MPQHQKKQTIHIYSMGRPLSDSGACNFDLSRLVTVRCNELRAPDSRTQIRISADGNLSSARRLALSGPPNFVVRNDFYYGFRLRNILEDRRSPSPLRCFSGARCRLRPRRNDTRLFPGTSDGSHRGGWQAMGVPLRRRSFRIARPARRLVLHCLLDVRSVCPAREFFNDRRLCRRHLRAEFCKRPLCDGPDFMHLDAHDGGAPHLRKLVSLDFCCPADPVFARNKIYSAKIASARCSMP